MLGINLLLHILNIILDLFSFKLLEAFSVFMHVTQMTEFFFNLYF